jgi:hypothetical protein
MRRGFGLLGAILTVVLLIVVATIGYNIGWSQGVDTHLPAGATNVPPYYYGYGFHPFFAGFGILWFLLIVFGIFWLLRLAFFGRRWGGWYGPRGMGHGGPGSFEERAQEWHRRQHGEQPPTGTAPPPPPPPADTRSV